MAPWLNIAYFSHGSQLVIDNSFAACGWCLSLGLQNYYKVRIKMMIKLRRSTKIILIFIIFLSCTQIKTEDEIKLWPEIEPFQSGYLNVSEIHKIYYELSGNPKGVPVFFIHGGPGNGCLPYHRRFFNPHKYLIILHDQRGCGRSRVSAL